MYSKIFVSLLLLTLILILIQFTENEFNSSEEDLKFQKPKPKLYYLNSNQEIELILDKNVVNEQTIGLTESTSSSSTDSPTPDSSTSFSSTTTRIPRVWDPIAKRFYFYSEEELELTKVVKIDPKICLNTHPMTVMIHSSASSEGQHFERRQAMRKGWIAEAKRLNVSVYFTVGLSTIPTVNDKLREESIQNSDLIQFSFIDSYYNLTLKAISILRWVHTNCLDSRFVLKTDDDAIVNIRTLLQNLNQFGTGFYGKVFYAYPTERVDRHAFPIALYPEPNLPDFMSGPAYMMANYTTELLLNAIDGYSGYIIDIDDVFMTGILAKSAGIPRYMSKLFQSKGCHTSAVCDLYKSPVVFECTEPPVINNYWTAFQRTSCESCGYSDC